MKNSFKHDIRLQKTKTALANGITVAVSMRYGLSSRNYIKDGHNPLVMTPQTEAPMLKSGTLMCSSF